MDIAKSFVESPAKLLTKFLVIFYGYEELGYNINGYSELILSPKEVKNKNTGNACLICASNKQTGDQ